MELLNLQLYVLDINPEKSAMLVPDKYKFKMLLELAQMISTITNNGIYKPIRQGKELRVWIDNNREWIVIYYNKLLTWTRSHTKAKKETIDKLERIIATLEYSNNYKAPVNAVFRYKEEYECEIASNTLLELDETVNQYRKYLMWKLRR